MKKFLSALIMVLFLATNCFSATGFVKGKPAGSDNPGSIATSVGENNAAIDLMLSTYIGGPRILYDTAAQFTVAAGGVMVSNSGGTIRLMLANSAATTVTWSDIDTGTEAASTKYYVYAIGSATTDTVFTVKISASSSAPTGVTYYKLLGWFYNDASSNIVSIKNENLPGYFDSGWFAIASNTNYSKTHSLGTTKVMVTIMTATGSSGENAVGPRIVPDQAGGIGWYALTTTTIGVKTNSLAADLWDGSTWQTPSYARIIVQTVE